MRFDINLYPSDYLKKSGAITAPQKMIVSGYVLCESAESTAILSACVRWA
jgi:hypothetical protein